mgnify:FL=1
MIRFCHPAVVYNTVTRKVHRMDIETVFGHRQPAREEFEGRNNNRLRVLCWLTELPLAIVDDHVSGYKPGELNAPLPGLSTMLDHYRVPAAERRRATEMQVPRLGPA